MAAGGCETPRLDAELLLAHALGVSRERLWTGPELAVEGPAVRLLQGFVRRRSAQREPVAYIVGRRHFRRLELAVDRRVLIPRAETELLVEVGLELPLRTRVLDLGTGSGAIALALSDERPDLKVVGADVSESALVLARENATRLGLDVTFMRADLLDGIPDDFGAILSNPPYIADSDRAQLAPEILCHEPNAALFAGPDGLEVIGSLVAQAGGRSAVTLLAIEVGAGQASAVGGFMDAARFSSVRVRRDLAGIERVVVGER